MDESILTSIKKLLGPGADNTQFDVDIIMAINSVFPALAQLGVGPEEGFEIIDDTSKWSDYLNGNKMLNNVKTYIYIKTRLIFDPPQSSITLEAMKQCAAECEWRIREQMERGGE